MDPSASPSPAPIRPALSIADAAVLVTQLAVGAWVFEIFIRILRQVHGIKFLSSDFTGVEIALLLLWLICVASGSVMGFSALRTIREQNIDRPGRGEAIVSIVICLTTVVVSVVGLITLAIMG